MKDESELLRETLQVVFRVSEGGSVDDARRLGELIRENPEARRRLRRFMTLRAHLRWQLAGPPHQTDVLGRVATRPERRPQAAGRGPRRRRTILAALGLAVCAALSGWFLRPAPEATLTRAISCVWNRSADGVPPRRLFAGQILDLSEGLIRVDFADGAVLVAKGPSTLTIESPHQVRLTSGVITASVPERARGFRVVTPDAEIVDWGTQFAVQVRPALATEVHVREGRVDVRAATGRAGETQHIGAGKAVRFRAGRIAPISFDKRRFLWTLDYASLVAAAAPAVRWSFAPDSANLVRNVVSDKSHLTRYGRVPSIRGATGDVAEFRESPEGSYLRLDQPISSLVGGPFSIEMTVRPQSGRHATLLALKHWTDQRAQPFDSLMIEIADRGFPPGGSGSGKSFRVVYRNVPAGGGPAALFSPDDVVVDRWYHVVVVKTKSLLQLWVDGRLAEATYAAQPLVEHDYVVLGDLIGFPELRQAATDDRHFSGQMDECLIYERPLTQREIETQAAAFHAEIE